MEWVVTLAAMGVLLIGVAGAAGATARRGSEWQRHVEDRWRAAAEPLGAVLQVSSKGLMSPRRLTLVRELPDVLVSVQTVVPVDPQALAHTRAFARYALGAGPAFRMVPREAYAALGDERSVLGEHALTPLVHLTTREPVAAALVWTEAARTLAAEFPRAVELRADGSALELVWSGVEREPDVLAGALALVGELAHAGVGVLRELAGIDGAVYVPLDEVERRPVVRLIRGPAEVCILAESSARGPVYLARAALAREVPPFDVHISGGVIEGRLPQGVIEPEESALLPAIGAARLGIEGDDVELAWDAAPSRESAEAAVRLLSAIAAGSGRKGAFR
jgi:hypothetical protein